jgi:hypothetical protein
VLKRRRPMHPQRHGVDVELRGLRNRTVRTQDRQRPSCARCWPPVTSPSCRTRCAATARTERGSVGPPVDVDQCRRSGIWRIGRWFILSGRFDMSAIIESEMISRRKALSLMGLAAAFGLVAAPTVLTVSDAEAQTVGMERRQERRAGRHERREVRRAGRHERREVRRTGTTTGTGTATTTGTAK